MEISSSGHAQYERHKHITEAVARSTPYRLDKEMKRATVKMVRSKMRKPTSIWQRNTNLTIPPEVHDSVAPYIKDVLRYKIPLSIEEKAPTFLTIEMSRSGSRYQGP
ncbi:hypothetical protein BJ878DRAFT_287185 [Calycina marina]|uniref:Uncharacterized protein n=1 Tax=Calycina marina TaxID=1763456 RepID=A0A9P7ZAV4_9HELO|nr:hypothetical protein BJ878DRAFT_287185 [Calycina marina]